MQFKLETPEHQRTAIRSVVEVLRGMERNTYDNATDEDIRANYCSLPLDALMANIRTIAADNGIEPSRVFLQETKDACIELESNTGKTLDGPKSISELVPIQEQPDQGWLTSANRACLNATIFIAITPNKTRFEYGKAFTMEAKPLLKSRSGKTNLVSKSSPTRFSKSKIINR